MYCMHDNGMGRAVYHWRLLDFILPDLWLYLFVEFSYNNVLPQQPRLVFIAIKIANWIGSSSWLSVPNCPSCRSILTPNVAYVWEVWPVLVNFIDVWASGLYCMGSHMDSIVIVCPQLPFPTTATMPIVLMPSLYPQPGQIVTPGALPQISHKMGMVSPGEQPGLSPRAVQLPCIQYRGKVSSSSSSLSSTDKKTEVCVL